MTNDKYEQFLFEKELAKRLVNSTLEERRTAYKRLYSEFFDRFPNVAYNPDNNPQENLRWQLKLLRPFLRSDTVFLEVGAGNCLLSVAVARLVKQVIAYEVADAIPHLDHMPDNLRLKIFDGIDLLETRDSINIIYSNQVFEHLHLDDTLHHIHQYYQLLKNKGHLVIVTPHNYTGPHDVSRNYARTPEGLHIKEYTFTELTKLLKASGFNHIRGYVGNKRTGYVGINTRMFAILEKLFVALPIAFRYKLRNNKVLLNVFGIKIIARK